MGNNQTTGQPVNYTHGNHVIKVTPGSPGEKGGLVPFFDYLVEANGVLLDRDNVLIDFLSVSAGKEIKFIVYNSKKEEIRETVITPADWNGQSKLGVSVRFSEIRPNMMEFVWHVLEVSKNSPASEAGLIANYDYIVGTTRSPFIDSEDFYSLVSKNHLKPVELYVYNAITDKVRNVILTPNPSWGGSGCLGCEVGYGLLHRIPSEDKRKSLLSTYNDEIPPMEALPDIQVPHNRPLVRPQDNLVIGHVHQSPNPAIQTRDLPLDFSSNPNANFNNNNNINVNNNNSNINNPNSILVNNNNEGNFRSHNNEINFIPHPNNVVPNGQSVAVGGSPTINPAPVVNHSPLVNPAVPSVYDARPYYPQIASPYKPSVPLPQSVVSPSPVPVSLPVSSPPLSPSPAPVPISLQSPTPLSPLANTSPSLETLQRLREKQAQLQAQLARLQVTGTSVPSQ